MRSKVMNRSTRGARRLCGTILSLAVLTSGLALPGYSSSRAARDDSARTRLKSRPGTQDGKAKGSRAPASAKDGGQVQDHEEPPEGRIAFASDRDDNFEIYLVDPDGGGLTRLTNNPAEDVGPAWSPDGTRLAFVSNRDGNQEIYTMNADGTGQTRLTNNPAADLEPAWSPDGTKILFVSNRDGNDEIYVMNADGSAQANLTNNGGDDNSPAWAPNGSGVRLLDQPRRRQDRDLPGERRRQRRRAADEQLRQRPRPDVGRGPDHVPERPRRQRRNLHDERGGRLELIRLTNSVDNPATTDFNEALVFDLDPARAPDGARIAFVSNRDGASNLDIYVMNADGSGVVRLTSHPNGDIDPAVQPRAAAQGAVRFSASSFTVSEGAGSVAVTVTRTGAVTGGLIVDLFTNSGTASERSDFTATFRTLEFAPGETSKVVNIPIIDDAFLESDETFSVTLARATGGGLDSPSTAIVTITDNDSPPSPAAPVTIFAVTTTNNSAELQQRDAGDDQQHDSHHRPRPRRERRRA